MTWEQIQTLKSYLKVFEITLMLPSRGYSTITHNNLPFNLSTWTKPSLIYMKPA